jgi:hypothetical protein
MQSVPSGAPACSRSGSLAPRPEQLLDLGLDRAPVAPRHRVGPHEGGRDPCGTEREGLGPSDPSGVDERHLEAPTTEVDRDPRVGRDRDARSDACDGRARLQVTGEDPQRRADRRLDRGCELRPVRRFAERRGRHRDHLVYGGPIDQIAEATDDLGGAIQRAGRHAAGGGDFGPEVQDDAVPYHRGQPAVGLDVADEELERGAAEIEDGDAHARSLSGAVARRRLVAQP